jgi:hypothetical protein
MSLEDLVVQVRLGRGKDRRVLARVQICGKVQFILLAYWHRIDLVGSWHLKATMTSPLHQNQRT